MAHSVRGLRQSVVLCGLEELPLILDLLQGSEAVTAVLRRSGLMMRSVLLNVAYDKLAGRGRQNSCGGFICCRFLFVPTFGDNCLLYLIIVISPPTFPYLNASVGKLPCQVRRGREARDSNDASVRIISGGVQARARQ